MLPKKIDKKHMGSHVPRLAFLPCKERVESSILFGSTNHGEMLDTEEYRMIYYQFGDIATMVRAVAC